MDLAHLLPLLLGAAWLLPLASFALIVLFGPRMGKHGVMAGHVATGAILGSALLSFVAFFCWLGTHWPVDSHHGDDHHAAAPHDAAKSDDHAHATADLPAADHADSAKPAYTGVWYSLGQFGALSVTIGYYIDTLTIVMFCMVTFIATCIHFYATGYMHDELHDITDHEVTLANGHHLHRPGRYHRFFQYLSLFCFSMLGLVYAGNIAMVFVFWELVGICSYFLIGFYIERKSASTAANKAFIVNRVGDFGMIIGLAALWAGLGTFSFGDQLDAKGKVVEEGLFSMVRAEQRDHALAVPEELVDLAAAQTAARENISVDEARPRSARCAYWLLVVGGLGIFCGCVGKSAQFPLHVWLPDAMEGPTPVSALVHSATMVAAGVYLVGRFYPVFTPEVLLVIGYVGAVTLILAATIAITATDIKRVLAYSTVSQLGYMMLSLGVGGWLAGLYHLITHAFFKSLLFMCSGSVIHACHTNEMTKMGGLRKKMPYTAYTMLAGCLAIAGAGLPFTVFGYHIGLSGYFSKDAIIAQALSFKDANPAHSVLFFAVAAGAAITAFYMFRLWFMTFAGKPRDHHIYDHAHESPKVMYVPLVVLAVMAVGVAWPLPFTNLRIESLLEQARPFEDVGAGVLVAVSHPAEHLSHAFHTQAGLIAFGTALSGVVLAALMYGLGRLNPEEVRKQFAPIHGFLRGKWYFDELYDVLFVKPTHAVAAIVSKFDKKVLDWIIDHLALGARGLSRLDDMFDRFFVDGLVNIVGNCTRSVGLALRGVQTGKIRQYVMFIGVATVAIFILFGFM